MAEESYEVVVTSTPPKPGEPPIEIRLRQWLKLGLRGLGIRCVSITERKKEPTNPAPEKGKPHA